MSSLTGGSKRCLKRLLIDNRSNLFLQPQQYASTQTTNHFSRTYIRSPLFRSIKQTNNKSSYSSSSSPKNGNGLIGWYMGWIESHPVLTKSATSALIYTVADLSSQAITRTSSDSFDLIRTLRMAGYGMLVMGPSLHYWFNFVSKVLPKRDVLNTMKKILLGQTVFGPIMTTIFFSVNAGLQGENGPEVIARLRRDLIPTLISGLMYWPLCDFVTFKFIPVRLQPLVSNSFAYLWTIYITYMATLEKADSSSISAIDSAS